MKSKNHILLIQSEIAKKNVLSETISVKLKDGLIDLKLITLLLPSVFLRDLMSNCTNCDLIIIPDIEKKILEKFKNLVIAGNVSCTSEDLGTLYSLLYEMFMLDAGTFFIEEEEKKNLKRDQEKNVNVFITENNCVCKYCCKSFERKDQCDEHVKAVHLKIKKKKKQNVNCLYCSICGKLFHTEVALKKHEESHQRKVFPCPTCNTIYNSHKNLIRHIKQKNHEFPDSNVYPEYENIVHNVNETTECDICHRMVGRLEYHKQKHHSEESRKFTCDLCEYETNRKDTLEKHQYLKHKITKRSFKCIDKTFEGKQIHWTCNNCNKTFESELDIENHLLLKNCEELKCKICEKEFTLSYNLKQHIKDKHSNPTKFNCEKCGKSFSYKRSLTKHMKKCLE